jgi:hypothetical protein
MKGFKNSERDPRVVTMQAVSGNTHERRQPLAPVDPPQAHSASGQLQLAAAAALCTAYTVSNELTRRSTDSEPSTAEIRQALTQMTSTLDAFAGAASAASQHPAGEESKWYEHGG